MRPGGGSGAVRESCSAEPEEGAVLPGRGAESSLGPDPAAPGRQSGRGTVHSARDVAVLSSWPLRPDAHNSLKQRVVPTFLEAPLSASLWEDTDLESRGQTRRSEGKRELFFRPGAPGDRASGHRPSLRKGPVGAQEETSGRPHNRDPGSRPASLPRLPGAWAPYFAPTLASGCSGGPRPLWALCLDPRSPTTTGSLTPRPGSPPS